MGLGLAEQLRTLSVNMYSSLYTNVQLSGASLSSIEVLLTLLEHLWINLWRTDIQIHSGIYWVAPATKSKTLFYRRQDYNLELLHPDRTQCSIMCLLFAVHCITTHGIQNFSCFRFESDVYFLRWLNLRFNWNKSLCCSMFSCKYPVRSCISHNNRGNSNRLVFNIILHPIPTKDEL